MGFVYGLSLHFDWFLVWGLGSVQVCGSGRFFGFVVWICD